MDIPALESRMASLIQADMDNVDPRTLPPLPASAQVNPSVIQTDYKMTTNSYALSRTERVWLLFSVTLLVSAAFYGVLAHRVVSVMDRPELTTCLQDFPVLLLISLSIGFFFNHHRAVRLASDPEPSTL